MRGLLHPSSPPASRLPPPASRLIASRLPPPASRLIASRLIASSPPASSPPASSPHRLIFFNARMPRHQDIDGKRCQRINVFTCHRKAPRVSALPPIHSCIRGPIHGRLPRRASRLTSGHTRGRSRGVPPHGHRCPSAAAAPLPSPHASHLVA